MKKYLQSKYGIGSLVVIGILAAAAGSALSGSSLMKKPAQEAKAGQAVKALADAARQEPASIVAAPKKAAVTLVSAPAEPADNATAKKAKAKPAAPVKENPPIELAAAGDKAQPIDVKGGNIAELEAANLARIPKITENLEESIAELAKFMQNQHAIDEANNAARAVADGEQASSEEELARRKERLEQLTQLLKQMQEDHDARTREFQAAQQTRANYLKLRGELLQKAQKQQTAQN